MMKPMALIVDLVLCIPGRQIKNVILAVVLQYKSDVHLVELSKDKALSAYRLVTLIVDLSWSR